MLLNQVIKSLEWFSYDAVFPQSHICGGGVSRPGFLPSAGESWGQEAAAGAACVADIILRLSLF